MDYRDNRDRRDFRGRNDTRPESSYDANWTLFVRENGKIEVQFRREQTRNMQNLAQFEVDLMFPYKEWCRGLWWCFGSFNSLDEAKDAVNKYFETQNNEKIIARFVKTSEGKSMFRWTYPRSQRFDDRPRY